MSVDSITDVPRLVLFDAGGVLVTPNLEAHRQLVGERWSSGEVRRHFYAAYTQTTIPVEGRHGDFWSTYAERLQLPGDSFEGLDRAASDKLLSWNFPVQGAADVLASVKEANIAVAVVSNAAGDVDRLLDNAGICHVGSGSGVGIDFIFDSGNRVMYPDERLSRKPHPRMLLDAFQRFEVDASEVLYVGDALWADALAAYCSGVPFLHLDPFGDCVDTDFPDLGMSLPHDGHDHVADIQEILPYAFGERARSLVIGKTSVGS